MNIQVHATLQTCKVRQALHKYNTEIHKDYQRKSMQVIRKRLWVCVTGGISNEHQLNNFLRSQNLNTEFSYLFEQSGTAFL